MNTRSHGTSTSSKKTMLSISSKREPSGWSKCDLPVVETVAAEEAQAGRVAGHGETQGERAVAVQMLRQPRRIDRDLVGERTERRQHAGATDDDAGGGFLHHLQRGAFLEIEHAADVAAALQVDQRMGQDKVVLGDIAVIAPHVLGEFRLARPK